MATTSRRTRGYVEQRSSGQWRAVVYAGVDPLTGRERRIRESAPTRKAAQAALSRLQTQVDERRHPRSGVTVGGLLEQWMEVARHETSTAERYSNLIRVYLQPSFGSMAAGKLDAELLERFYGRLLRCRKLCSGPAARPRGARGPGRRRPGPRRPSSSTAGSTETVVPREARMRVKLAALGEIDLSDGTAADAMARWLGRRGRAVRPDRARPPARSRGRPCPRGRARADGRGA
jgi:hypothetical protein